MVSSSTSALRRALLYVPASSTRMLTKSLGLTCDTIIYDLEDSVTPDAKTEARDALNQHLSRLSALPPSVSEIAIRVNRAGSSFLEKDLKLAASIPLVDTVVVPKVNTIGDLRAVSHVLKNFENKSYKEIRNKPIRVIAMIESARAIMNISSIIRGPRLNGLMFAAEDFALDLSLTRTPDLTEFLYARSAMVTAARVENIPSVIDLVCTSYQGKEGLTRLEEECRGGKAMGFNGKQCIHPSQVETVQRLFSPSKKEVEWAVRITVANKKAAAEKRGAWTLDGKMIDAPVFGRAVEIVEKARKCGMDVDGLREKWKDQEPE
ncbi:Citrate lyase subunit beta [Daldinia childiae]|uniref:Citrate lyase subunit beta n=1 Tax=Daldinia childiae TaxID=326645 RepID=UPI001445F9A4|nr:Citrate lyase subunit beta [Daldinia childiae]XP_033437644.1 Citrate lyase subunit beta [Daldinia childiae]KAF3060922.1 Citrate lyase subunit beta [Daldinia childiae]KAF3062769.1 Citrate lyase subunit beta [Daldinia childiae]